MNITFIAPPAGGKGTQSAKVSKKYGIPHISTGDLLRNTNDEGIKNLLKQGKFVNEDIVTKLLKERLSQSDCDKGYVLDGYPRTLKQAQNYEAILKELGKEDIIIIVLDLDKEIAAKRVIGREICQNCGHVFNNLFEDTKSKKENICDNCGDGLTKRADDTLETFEKRYHTYQTKTEPLIKHYEAKGIVYHVNSGINKDYTFREIEKIIGGLYDKH